MIHPEPLPQFDLPLYHHWNSSTERYTPKDTLPTATSDVAIHCGHGHRFSKGQDKPFNLWKASPELRNYMAFVNRHVERLSRKCERARTEVAMFLATLSHNPDYQHHGSSEGRERRSAASPRMRPIGFFAGIIALLSAIFLESQLLALLSQVSCAERKRHHILEAVQQLEQVVLAQYSNISVLAKQVFYHSQPLHLYNCPDGNLHH